MASDASCVPSLSSRVMKGHHQTPTGTFTPLTTPGPLTGLKSFWYRRSVSPHGGGRSNSKTNDAPARRLRRNRTEGENSPRPKEKVAGIPSSQANGDVEGSRYRIIDGSFAA